MSVEEQIIALERAALDRWGKGDPGGYLEISTKEVSYFDPFQDNRLDGIGALTDLYQQIWGKIQIERDEIIDPRVQVMGDVAILTFRFISHGSEGSMKWNCTEVYQRSGEYWRIAHTHWSFTKAGVPGSNETELRLSPD